MAQQIRCSLSDEAYAVLLEACGRDDQGATRKSEFGQVISTALLRLFAPEQEMDVRQDVVQLQNIRIMAMLEHLMRAQGCWPEAEPAQEAAPVEASTSDVVAQYTGLYGDQWLHDTEVRPPPPPDVPRLTGWKRLVFKESSRG